MNLRRFKTMQINEGVIYPLYPYRGCIGLQMRNTGYIKATSSNGSADGLNIPYPTNLNNIYKLS